MKTRQITTIEELDEFNLFMKKFWAAYPNANASEETLMIYSEDLAELPMQDLELAFKALRRKSFYLPAISELYGQVEAIQNQRASQKLLATSSQPSVAEMMQWKREPIPEDIAAQLDGWKQLLDSASMPQKTAKPLPSTSRVGEGYWN